MTKWLFIIYIGLAHLAIEQQDDLFRVIRTNAILASWNSDGQSHGQRLRSTKSDSLRT